jgi:predicted thioesterase
MKEDDEEGIGTYLELSHQGPAFVGEEVTFRGQFVQFTGRELTCTFEVHVGDRLIARGKTGQKILKLDTLKSIFSHG